MHIARKISYLSLMLFLVFAQYTGTVHMLSHFSATPDNPDHSLPHSKVCEKCIAYAGIDSPIISSALIIVSAFLSIILSVLLYIAFTALPTSLYQPRAPPAPL